MADNSKIYTAVPGSATTETVSITFPFLKKSHIEVRVSNAGETLSAFKTRLAAGSVTAETFNTDYSITGTTVTFVTATLDNGSTYQVETKRNSDILTSYVDFVDGSIVTESNLDDAHTQQLYVSQELQDNKATLKEDGSIAADITGDITGDVTGNADTVTTNANLTGGVTSVGNAATVVTNANLTGGVTSVGNAATVVTNANLTGEVTSSGNAATIANDIVDEANLKSDNAPTDDFVLTAKASASGGLTWSAAGAGDIIGVTAGTNLSGGGTSGTVTLNLDNPVVANLTGNASGSSGSCTGNAATVTTNANLTGGVTSVGNAATVVTNANLTGGVTSVGNAATVVTNANLTGDVTSSGNATTIATDAVDIAMLSATGTASSSTFLRGDNAWAAPAGGGSGDMTGVDITAGDGLTRTQSNTTSGDYTASISADLKANGGVVIESAELAVDLAASSITGTLAVSDGGTGLTSLATMLNANVIDTTQVWTKAQTPATQTASFSTTPDFDAYQNFIYTLASGANTFAAATTEAGNVGQTGLFVFIQPSSSSAGTVALHADYESVGGSGITLSSVNSSYDIVPYIIKADNSILLGAPQLAFS